jgi:hypothetical protein
VKGIGALLGVGLAGVFIGALTMEIVHRFRPNLVKDLETSTKKGLGVIGDAFKQGYHGEPLSADEAASGKSG